MTITYQKLEILQSLNNLDAAQSEKVLNFINGLLKAPEDNLHQRYVRTLAMEEIGQALREIKTFSSLSTLNPHSQESTANT